MDVPSKDRMNYHTGSKSVPGLVLGEGCGSKTFP